MSPIRKAYSEIRQKEVISGRFPIAKSELAQCCLRDGGPIKHFRPAQQSRNEHVLRFRSWLRISRKIFAFFFVAFLYITDSTKFLQCLLFTDSRSQLQHSDTSTKSVKRRKHRKWRGKIKPSMGVGIYCRMLHSFGSLSVRQPVFGKNCSPRAETDCINYIRGRNQF